MHRVDCARLLAEDSPDALVLSVLCDFQDRSPRAVIRYILDRLQVLTEGTPARFRDYLKMLEILSSNRNLYEVVKEEQTMLSEVLITELPSYGLGMERGMEQGMEQGIERGEQLMLSRLLQKRFGPLPHRIQTRLEAASTTELEAWAEQVLDGIGLEQFFPDV